MYSEMVIAYTCSYMTSCAQQIQYYQGLSAVPCEKVNDISTEVSEQGSEFASTYTADNSSDAKTVTFVLPVAQ